MGRNFSEFNCSEFHTGIYIMKTRFASSIRLSLVAGALALVVAGCSGTMHRDNDRMADTSGYAGQSGTPGIPPSIDPYSSGYRPFPVMANERSSVSGRSFFCEQHYSQPGCQSGDTSGTR
jgi:hypothetical protein